MNDMPLQKILTTCDDFRIKESDIRFPMVSIIITSYNYAKYIVHCLDSVQRQTYPHWEMIIVDDASTDGTIKILEAYVARHVDGKAIQYIRRSQNGGQMEAFRDGLSLARGAFVMMLDADDVLLPDFLDNHVRVHLGKKAVAFTSSNQYQINENGEIICGDHPDHLGKGEYRYVPQQLFHDTWWAWATASSMVFRRSTLDLIMPDPGVTFRICADYYLAHFCQQVGNSILIPGIYGCYRRHGANNFSANPLLGAINAMGDFASHPPHKDYREAMALHIVNHYDRFKPIFGHMGILIMLFRILPYKEMKDVLRSHGEKFATLRGNLLKKHKKFCSTRKYYDRSPWEERLMRIDPPQQYFVPPPPTPGTIVSTAIKKRMKRFFLGSNHGGETHVK